MTISQNGLNQIKKHEGLRLQAYRDIVGVPTIGYGNTYYENGVKVKMGERISIDRAEQLLRNIVNIAFAKPVSELVTSDINQNQFDALVSFAYNVGIGAFSGSTLLKRVNANPNDPDIKNQFARWNKAGGKVTPGLTKRRKQESDMYFSA